LAGKRKDGKVSGHILLNGKQVHESEIRRAVGFVDQEDTLPATQTVWEAVLFSAMLRLPEAMPIYRIHERVSEVIEMLGLTHCKDRIIGDVTSRGISGGEKRRVSIALELITRPPILILDEPTSGLDSYSAHMVVQQLCKLAASKTTTVIMTIHQPRSDIFYMFDQTLVIAKGTCMYFGPSDSAADYFRQRGLACPSTYNIADYLLDIATDEELLKKAMMEPEDSEYPEKLGVSTSHQLHENGNVVSRRNISSPSSQGRATEDQQQSSETMVQVEETGGLPTSNSSTASISNDSTTQLKKRNTVYPTSFLTQLQVIMKRNFQTLLRNRSLLVLHLTVSFVLGIFVGGLYFNVTTDLGGFQNRAGSLFFMLALLGFSSVSALGAFTETRILFIKERSNGYYQPMPFIISTLLFDLVPLRIIPALLMGSVSYFMIGLTSEVQTFLKFLLILVLFNISTAMFCLVIAAGVRTTGVASLASSIVMLFMMLFGGFLINSKQIPKALTWIQYLSMFKYGFEALAVNEVATTSLIDSIQGVAFNVPGSLILQKLFGFELGSYWRNVIVLVGFVVLFVATFWMLVSLRLKERK
jgi:ABC-type multidrug transport system ATPase subunit/ABC-type multidrug transport system permease subunit